MQDTVCLSTAYLAPVEYYLQMNSHPQVVFEQHDHYLKQTYRNRCVIASANGPQALSIPVESFEKNTLTRDIRIAEHGNWRHLHWNAIVSAYNSSPFFEYYEDDFRPFYEKKYDFLFDFNEQLRSLVCSLLDMNPLVSCTELYEKQLPANVLDLRESIHPKKAPSLPEFKTYYQVFDQKFGFQPNLSIIDLLFNMGPEAVLVLDPH